MRSGAKSVHQQFFTRLLGVRFFIIMMLVALFVDMEVSNEAHLFYKDIANDLGVTVFIFISSIYLVSQQYIMNYSIKEYVQKVGGMTSFRLIRKVTNSILFFVMVCVLTIVIEILFPEYYDTFLLILVLAGSNAVAIIVMSDMSSKFFSWYRIRKQPTILIFGTMALIISITAFITILYMGTVLIGQPEKVNAEDIVILPTIVQGSVLSVLNYLYFYLAISSYVITWIITALLLRDYKSKVGKFKYWFVLSLPLVFYLSQLLVTQLGLFIPEDEVSNLNFQMWFLIFYTPSSLIGGILFSIPFFMIIRTLDETNHLKNFLRITAYGLIIFFAAGSATVYHTPYPPFGLLTIAAIGPSAYLIALGVYYSARLISMNKTIEIQLKRSSEYSHFFANIGSAEMEKTVTQIVEQIRKKLPLDEQEPSKEFETVDKELIEYLRKFKSGKSQ